MESVLIYETTDSLELAQIKGILDNHGITYFVKNEKIQNLLSDTSLIAGYDVIAGSFLVFVSKKNADKVRDIIERFKEGLDFDCESTQALPDEEEYPDYSPLEDKPEITPNDKTNIIKLLCLSLLSYFSVFALYSIKLHVALKGKFKVARTVFLLFQIPLFYYGLKSLIGSIISDSILASINGLILLVILGLKGVEFMVKKRYVIGVLLMLPLLSLCGFVIFMSFNPI